MAAYLPLDRFKAIYVVDLCHSLCLQARAKAEAKGWSNVHVVEGDACTWQLPAGQATLVTFSYSLSSAPLSASDLPINLMVPSDTRHEQLHQLT